MNKIVSKDGIPIACWQSGQGDPLLLVHGTTGDHQVWSLLLPLLAARFSVWTLDRRGRGHSGDAPDYNLARESEDLAAVIDSLGPNVAVFGHSFGGLCALEAARLTRNIGKLIVYEPPLSMDGSGWSPELDMQMQTLLAQGNYEEVLLLFFRDILKTPTNELAGMQLGANWLARVATAPTIRRELLAISGYQFVDGHFAAVNLPVLLLLGSESPPRRHRIAQTLLHALPNSRLAVLPNQQHSAIRTAPTLVAEEIFGFLATP